MPPKQVYGRRAAPKSAAAFTNFISADAEAEKHKPVRRSPRKVRAPKTEEAAAEVLSEEERSTKEKEDVSRARKAEKAERKIRRALEVGDVNASKQPKKTSDAKDLVDGLGSLTIKETETASVESKPARSKSGRNGKQTKIKQPKKEEVVDLADTLNALKIVEPEVHLLTPRSKKSTHARKASAGTDDGKPMKGVASPQASEDAPKTKQQTLPVTPVRPKATLKSSRSPVPKMTSVIPDVALDDNPYNPYVCPLLALSYARCIMPFQQWSSLLEEHCTIAKIAEASFSEVYRVSSSTGESILKVVALKRPLDDPVQRKPRGRAVRNPEAHAARLREIREQEDAFKSEVADVHSEVRLLQNLNSIPGFTNFRDITILQGRPSAPLNKAWKAWEKSRPDGRKSEFPDPSKKASYDDTQLWAVIEMQDAGTDVEKVMAKGGLGSVWEVWDVFWGVCLSIAKAEKACRFEHRDMHLENICIRSTRSDAEMDLTAPTVKKPLKRKLGFTGLETTVIDYTLSRADVYSSPARSSPSSLSTPSTPAHSTLDVAYLDLNKDPAIFAGDASEEYQYEIYRYMRGAAYFNDPLCFDDALPVSSPLSTPPVRRSPRKTAQHIRFDEEDEPVVSKADPNIWRAFHPKTNLVWAHFLLHRLLLHLKTQGRQPCNLPHAELMRHVDAGADSAAEVQEKAVHLHAILKEVATKLEPGALAGKQALSSVTELVVVAMEERWLRRRDVMGKAGREE